MPKESSHIYLNFRLREYLKSRKELKQLSKLIESSPNLFMTGAMAPDSVFNYMHGAEKKTVKSIEGWAHGESGEDLFGYFRRFQKLGIPTAYGLPFGLGVLCHLCADMAFHPFVFYFCGEDLPGSKEATYRHLALETEIDIHLRWFYPELIPVHMQDFYSQIECTRETFAQMLKSVHLSDENIDILDASVFSSMYRQHCSHDMLYGKKAADLFANFLTMLTLGKRKEPALLFYTDRRLPPAEGMKDAFENELIIYKNPVTGEALETSFNQMVDKFFSLFHEYTQPLGNLLEGSRPDWDDILPEVNLLLARSPHSGRPMADGKEPEMSYFEIKTFNEIWGALPVSAR